MITLLERCQGLSAKMQQLTLAQRHANQERRVQERTREWASCYERLKILKVRTGCLKLNDAEQKGIAEKRGRLQHNATEVLERLTSHQDIDQLTKDASWARLLASVEGLSDELEICGKAAWSRCVEEHGELEDPTWLRGRAPSTPANDAAIAAYEQHYAAYASLTKLRMPRGADDLSNLVNAISACRAEAAKIAFEVPPTVQQFFLAIQSGTATLASLGPGVLEWLKENGQLERYRIRSAT